MRVIDLATGSAWAMEESALVTLMEVAHREHQITPEALEAFRADKLTNAERATTRDGVAILSVNGPLFKRANMMTELCGASSYDVLMRDFATALGDGNVRAILLAIDSPGGEAAGCAEFASAVAAARGKKPIVAYAGDLAASAAYWIASACDRIIIGRSGAVGSIGVRMSMTDTSERDAKSGARRFDFVSSQSPYKVNDPKTKDGNARIKARVDSLAQVFVEAVAENRGVSVAQVLDGFGKGDLLIGAAAVTAGMADRIGTFESVLADLIAERPVAAAPRPAPPPWPAPETPTRAALPSRLAASAAEIARLDDERAVAMILAARHPPSLAAASPVLRSGDAETEPLPPARGGFERATPPAGASDEDAAKLMLAMFVATEPDASPRASAGVGDEAAAQMILAAWRDRAA